MTISPITPIMATVAWSARRFELQLPLGWGRCGRNMRSGSLLVGAGTVHTARIMDLKEEAGR